MMIDTIVPSAAPENLSVADCKAWWEKKVAEGYFTAYAWTLSSPELYARIPLGQNSVILEIGPGYGRQLSEFLEVSDHVYGIEVSPSAIRLCKQHCSAADVREFDGTKIPFETGFFDFVTAVFVFQHISKANTRQLIVESFRVLKPGGCFLFEFLGGHGVAGEGNEHYSGGLEGMYNNGYTQDEIRGLCASLGIPIAWIEEVPITEDGVTNIWLCVEK